jgi:outer membrane lipoprotein-sorting protein
MKIITSLFTLLFLVGVYAQVDDPRSKKIIDDMAAKFKTYPSVALNFSLTVTQLQVQSEIEQEGKIWVKNNMYKFEIPDQVIFFDGTKIYQYLPEFKEVNVTKPEGYFLTPTICFTGVDTDFTFFCTFNNHTLFCTGSRSKCCFNYSDVIGDSYCGIAV